MTTRSQNNYLSKREVYVEENVLPEMAESLKITTSQRERFIEYRPFDKDLLFVSK